MSRFEYTPDPATHPETCAAWWRSCWAAVTPPATYCGEHVAFGRQLDVVAAQIPDAVALRCARRWAA